VLGYGDATDEDEEEDDEDMADEDDAEYEELVSGKRKPAEDEEEEGWGPSKKDYYNADAIETEQDALDEEAEARRIQQKQLQAMTEADFGFDENEWLGQEDGEKGPSGKVVTEVLPQLQITDDMTEDEKLKILHSRYPEFEPIRQDFLRLEPLHAELKAAAEAAERLAKSRAKPGNSDLALRPKSTAVLKYWACASYLGAICMYFAILTSTAKDGGSSGLPMDPAELHEHPVMESLLKCQRLWARVENLPVDDPMVVRSDIDELSVIQEASPEPDHETKLKEAIVRKRQEKKLKKKSKAQLAAEAAQAEADARRAEKLRKTEQELATLAALTDKSALRKAIKQKKAPQQPLLNLLNAEDSDFGEETELTAHELAEKARKKKSLRFYTSQITQKASKRGAAGKDQGGDADIPHRERLKDRQARLQAEAERRGQNKDKGPGVLLGEGGDSDDDDDAGHRRADDAGEEDYYDMVAARNKAKKQEKAEKAAAYALAAKENATVVPEETIGPDGKRKITYLIQKNKGLTPHRKKEVRNPRVKKKLKFEAKKKALKSMKPVYGGGEGRGGYQGELTGIKTGLVRSTKL
jgi:U3 small nucleolar RNA-associated protein 3